MKDAPSIALAASEMIDAHLRDGTMVKFTVPTGSMLPTLAPGDRVTARALRDHEPRIGDIALIRTDQTWLAHRLIERRVVGARFFYVTQGDNCFEADALWSAEQIRAIIVSVDHNGSSANLESGRARVAGAIIASLARLRSRLGGRRPNILSRFGGRMVRAGALIAQRTVGLR